MKKAFLFVIIFVVSAYCQTSKTTQEKLFVKYGLMSAPKYSFDNKEFISTNYNFASFGSFRQEFKDLFNKDENEFKYLLSAERSSQASSVFSWIAVAASAASLFIKDEETGLVVAIGAIIPLGISGATSSQCNSTMKKAIEERNKRISSQISKQNGEENRDPDGKNPDR